MRLDFPELGRIHAERADLPPPTPPLLRRLHGLRRLAVLDSAAGGRYTVVAATPLARFTWRPGLGEVALPGGARVREPSLVEALRSMLLATAAEAHGPLPFGPGWLGYLGYGARVAFEEVPERHADETGLADVDLSYYPAVAVYDAEEATWWFVSRWECADTLRTIRACLLRAMPELPPVSTGSARPMVAREAYLAAVRRAVEYIHAGDVFQVNYAHEFRAAYRGDPLALYLALREANPSPYGAYLDLGRDAAVFSTSPELFLRVRGHEVTTRPIKGTRPRGADEVSDRRLREELRGSEKDAAELAMIVDLERNDLGRVCAPGTVEVVTDAEIESYATVHHRVAEVRGEIEEGFDRVDLLAATFPGGSITGAPKVRAMEIIDELEAGRRGPYTGAIGLLSDDGNMDLNIAIRTPVLAKGEVRVHVGGGIVADSVPEAEYDETLAKGRAIFEVLSLTHFNENRGVR
ncbi:MAG: aminodeoxychorismate synthase component I [Planctomycetota bacterium]